MNRTNRNAGPISGSDPAQNTCGVSELYAVKVAHFPMWGISSGGLKFPNLTTAVVFDVVTTMAVASREQRRDIIRGLKRDVRNGEPGAAEALADARRLAALRSLALRNGEAGAVEALADAQRLAALRNPAIHDHRGML